MTSQSGFRPWKGSRPFIHLKMWGTTNAVICLSTPPAAPHSRLRLGLCRIARAMLASRG